MLEIILNSIVSYISTNMDYILVLVLLIHAHRYYSPILIGDMIGTTILTITPMTIAILLGAVPETWMLGFLGLFPLYFSFKSFFGKNSNNDLDESDNKSRLKLVIHTVIITVAACGADNVAVYIPIFIRKSMFELIVAFCVMLIMAIVFFGLAIIISKNKQLEKFLNRYGKYLTGVIYLYLGISVLMQCGTITHFIHL
ncbi:cadmium resistance transporter [Fructilactobacillus frigidiflavus]|uniref:cadmium resistance transporter n=1 Tax=Fructilactobacillus frigidiflavus TaxID=3242688 RepID=UPI0037577410